MYLYAGFLLTIYALLKCIATVLVLRLSYQHSTNASYRYVAKSNYAATTPVLYSKQAFSQSTYTQQINTRQQIIFCTFFIAIFAQIFTIIINNNTVVNTTYITIIFLTFISSCCCIYITIIAFIVFVSLGKTQFSFQTKR